MIASEHEILVKEIFQDNLISVAFLRNLAAAENSSWEALLIDLDPIRLSAERNVIGWDLEASSSFTVKSMYVKLVRGPPIWYSMDLWSSSVCLTIKIFLWQAARYRLPSAINLQKQHGPGNGLCAHCVDPEDANYIVFLCPLSKYVWICVGKCLGRPWGPFFFPRHVLPSSEHSRATT